MIRWTDKIIAGAAVVTALSSVKMDPKMVPQEVFEIAVVIAAAYLVWHAGWSIWITLEQRRREREAKQRAHEKEQKEERRQELRRLIGRLESVLIDIGDFDYDSPFGVHGNGSGWRTSEAMAILQIDMKQFGISLPPPQASRREWRDRLRELLVLAKVGKLVRVAGHDREAVSNSP